jgi:hypothetical protein
MKRTILATVAMLAALALGATAKADSAELFLLPDTIISPLVHPEGTVEFKLTHPRPFDGVYYQAIAADPTSGEYPTIAITNAISKMTVDSGITENFPGGDGFPFVYVDEFDAKGILRSGGGTCVESICTGLATLYRDEGYIYLHNSSGDITFLYLVTDESPFPIGIDSLVVNGPSVVTPEPGTLLLVSAALAGLVLRRRKLSLKTTVNLVG